MSGSKEEVSMPLTDKELAELKRKREMRDAPQKKQQKKVQNGGNVPQQPVQQPMQQMPQFNGMYGQPTPQPSQQQMMEMYQQQMMQQMMQQMFTEQQVETVMLADAITVAMEMVGEGLIQRRLLRARSLICEYVGINDAAIYGGANQYAQPVYEEEGGDEGGEPEEPWEEEELPDDGGEGEEEEEYNGDMPQESIG